MKPPIHLLIALLVLPGMAYAAESTATLPDQGRVLLAPLNLGVRAAPELTPGLEPVWDELVRHFEGQDPAPASLAPEGAAALWTAAARADAEDSDVYAAYARFARRVAEQVEFSVIVIPALVTRSATIAGHVAHWDGVHRLIDTPRIEGSADSASNMLVQTHGGRGALRAASLHVAILGPDGELRFEGAGGIALLQRLELSGDGAQRSIRVTAHPSPFEDPASLRKGVRMAFEHPLPASRAH